MDEVASSVLATLKKPSVSAEAKIAAINTLKSSIKHQRIPESAQATTLECLRLAVTSQSNPSLVSTALSGLGHLIKRLTLQDETSCLFAPGVKLLSILLERLGDAKETHRAAASQLFCDLWATKPIEVERTIREGAIQASNVRAKIAGMQWVTKMHEEQSLQFRGFVPTMVECLEDADGTVRETAKTNIVELFRSARDSAKADLKRQLIAHNVRKSIAEHILSQLSIPVPAELSLNASFSSTGRPQTPHVEHRLPDAAVEPTLPPSVEATTIDPLYVHAQRELEDIFRAIQPCFEGRESEDNWRARDNSVLKMRRLLKGNAPQDHHAFFVSEVKNLLDGFLKVANSLRTTTSSNGCRLVQELAATIGAAIDPMAEILLRGFEKMCAATKHIAAQNGNATIEAVLTYASYNVRHMQHIHAACSDKNVQPRQFACGWLKIMLKKQIHNKSHFEHTGGLDLAEKSIKKGLTDANPKVREVMRGTYWCFAQTWPEKAESIMATLDAKSKSLLERDSANPNAGNAQASFTASVGPASTVSHRAPLNARASLKDAIAAQRNAAKRMPERPASAMSTITPSRGTVNASTRPATKPATTTQARSVSGKSTTASSTSTTSTGHGSLMSAPVRRPKRPDVPRPATADPYGRRNERYEETPPRSPIASPPRQSVRAQPPSKQSSHVKAKSTTTIGIVQPSSPASSAGMSPRLSPTRSRARATPANPHIGASNLRAESNVSSSGSRDGNPAGANPDSKLAQRSPLYTSRSRNSVDDRPHSGHSSLLDTVDEDNFTLVIPEKGRFTALAAAAQPYLQHDEVPIKNEVDERNDDAVMVYEDPSADDIVAPTIDQDIPVVLEEKAVNEQNLIHRQTHPVDTATSSPPSSPPQSSNPENQNQPRPRTASPTKKAVDPSRSISPTKRVLTTSSASNSPAVDRAEVLKARRLLASGTDRVRTSTLDAHGFRRLQDLIKTHASTPDVLFVPVLDALVESLRSPAVANAAGGVPKPSAAGMSMGLKNQALSCVKAIVSLCMKRDDQIRDTIPDVLVGLAKAAPVWEGERTGGVLELEKAADEIIKRVTTWGLDTDEHNTLLDDCIGAAAAFVQSCSTDHSASKPKAQTKAAAFALTLLARLVPRVLRDHGSRATTMPDGMRQRLARLTVRGLADLDADVRRRSVELALELYAAFPATAAGAGASLSEDVDVDADAHEQTRAMASAKLGKAGFWETMRPAGEQSCNLLAYYLARRERAGLTG